MISQKDCSSVCFLGTFSLQNDTRVLQENTGLLGVVDLVSKLDEYPVPRSIIFKNFGLRIRNPFS